MTGYPLPDFAYDALVRAVVQDDYELACRMRMTWQTQGFRVPLIGYDGPDEYVLWKARLWGDEWLY